MYLVHLPSICIYHTLCNIALYITIFSDVFICLSGMMHSFVICIVVLLCICIFVISIESAFGCNGEVM